MQGTRRRAKPRCILVCVSPEWLIRIEFSRACQHRAQAGRCRRASRAHPQAMQPAVARAARCGPTNRNPTWNPQAGTIAPLRGASGSKRAMWLLMALWRVLWHRPTPLYLERKVAQAKAQPALAATTDIAHPCVLRHLLAPSTRPCPTRRKHLLPAGWRLLWPFPPFRCVSPGICSSEVQSIH